MKMVVIPILIIYLIILAVLNIYFPVYSNDQAFPRGSDGKSREKCRTGHSTYNKCIKLANLFLAPDPLETRYYLCMDEPTNDLLFHITEY